MQPGRLSASGAVWPPHLRAGGEAPRAQVDRAIAELPELAPTLRLDWRHGDFSPRNWIWNPVTDDVALIDYEKSGIGIVAEDLAWLHATTWTSRPELEQAFLTGFGCQLDDAERAAIDRLAALAALSYLEAGLHQHNDDLVEKANRAFAAIQETHPMTLDGPRATPSSRPHTSTRLPLIHSVGAPLLCAPAPAPARRVAEGGRSPGASKRAQPRWCAEIPGTATGRRSAGTRSAVATVAARCRCRPQCLEMPR